MGQLIETLKRRKVLQTAGIYLGVSWLVLQLAAIIAPALFLPDWAVTFVLLLLLAGIPVVLVLSWYFEMTLHGLKRDRESRRHIRPRIGLSIAAMVMIGAGTVIFEFLAIRTSANAAVVEQQRAHASIAVLPFRNLSEDQGQEYFSDGLSEQILNKLADINALAVTARSSSFAFKGQDRDIRSIGGALNVNYILDGSIRMAGSQLRLSVQLLETSGGTQVWSSDFSSDVTGVFATEADISARVTESLSAELAKQGIAEIDLVKVDGPPQGIDPLAYDLFLKTKAASHIGDAEKNQFQKLVEIRNMARTVTTLAPEFTEGWVELAIVERFMSERAAGDRPWREALSAGLAAMDHASKLEPDSARVNQAYGRVYYGHDNKKSIRYLERAIRQNPNMIDAWALGSRLFALHKRWPESFEAAEKAYELNPLDETALNRMAIANAYRGHFAEASKMLKEEQERSRLGVVYPGAGASIFHALEGRHDQVLADGAELRAWMIQRFGDVDWVPDSRPKTAVAWMNTRVASAALTLGRTDIARQWSEGMIDYTILIYEDRLDEAAAETGAKINEAAQVDGGYFAYLSTSWMQVRALQGKWGEIVDHADQIGWGPNVMAPPIMPHYVFPSTEADIAHAFLRAGHEGRARDWLKSVRGEYEERLEAGFDMAIYHYDLARTLILQGETEAGLARLKVAIDKGWSWWYTPRDPVFDSVRDSPGFAALMAQHEANIAAQKEGLTEIFAEAGLEMPEEEVLH